jgi:hypothetical protein
MFPPIQVHPDHKAPFTALEEIFWHVSVSFNILESENQMHFFFGGGGIGA